MEEKKNGLNDVSDAATIIGKDAEEITEAINELSGENNDVSDDMGNTRVIDSVAVMENTTQADTIDKSESQEDNVPKKIMDDGYAQDGDFDEDVDDFSESPSTRKPDITGNDSEAPLTAPVPSIDPSLDKAIDMTMKKDYSHIGKKIKKRAIITASLIAGIFVLLFIIALLLRPTDRVSKNVWIGDLYVGGLTYEETLSAIETSDLINNYQIRLRSGGKDYTFNSADIGSSIVAEDTAKLAYNYGKSGNILKDGINSMRVLFAKRTLRPSANLNTDMLAEVLKRFGRDIYGELKQHSIEYEGTTATVIPGHTGFDEDVTTALKQVQKALRSSDYDVINVTLKSAPPYDFTIETFDHLCYADPVDAYYKIENNNVEVIAEVPGRYINKDEVKPLLSLIKEGGEPVQVPIYISEPAIKAETLQAKLFADTLGSYSTYYGAGGNRGANVARAASLINGKVLAPGEVFSFNDTVGKRTTANGFFTAKEYVNGQSVDGIGGGTCQVSTTLYSAVLYADMNIVERECHMMTIAYAPLGQDATVADGSIDFKFRNSSDYPIKIVSTTSGGKITVSIVGTSWEPKREVKLSHSTSYSNGNTIVKSTRYVYANGELISTDALSGSFYRPHSTEEPTTSSGGSSSGSSPSSSPAPSTASPESAPSNTTAPQNTSSGSSASSSTSSGSSSAGSSSSDSSSAGSSSSGSSSSSSSTVPSQNIEEE